MINKTALSAFFDLEAEAARENWKKIMQLSVSERIRKRKAIQDVRIAPDPITAVNNGVILLRVTFEKNLSDFKEGEFLILHKTESSTGIKCCIEDFDGHNAIILEIYRFDIPPDIKSYFNIPLILDRAAIDLRHCIFYPFLHSLPEDSDLFWDKLLLNNRQPPVMRNKLQNKNVLDKIMQDLKLSLLPRQQEAILNSMSAKDYYLIQGPPGTGKSFVLSIIMHIELFILKHNIIVIGPNHLAVNNTLEKILELTPEYGHLFFKIGKKHNASNFFVTYQGKERSITNIEKFDSNCGLKINEQGHNWICGMTPHSLYTNRCKNMKCDTLIIDEAAQMTIPLALMGMLKADKFILAGDHKQLPPIVNSDKVVEPLNKSVFQTLVRNDNCTMLNVSFRMCDAICNFVSDLFYDGKLQAKNSGLQELLLFDNKAHRFEHPVIIHHISDNGEQISDKETAFIIEIISEMLKKGISAKDIGVLSPFRAQAANIRRCIKEKTEIFKENRTLIKSETIDTMQGQERKVIIFSMTAGNPAYMEEMAEFLYNPNKLNVAFSRAKHKLIIVGNIRQLSKLSILNEYPHLQKMLHSKYAVFENGY